MQPYGRGIVQPRTARGKWKKRVAIGGSIAKLKPVWGVINEENWAGTGKVHSLG